MTRTSADVEQARIAIASRGSGDPGALLELAGRLREDNQIGYARRVLEAALECAGAAGAAERIDIRLELAFATYKDPDLPLADRLNRALAMVEALLEDFPALPPEKRQRALATAGAVHRRRWRVHGMKTSLEAARACYLEAGRLGIEMDAGSTAVNAAFTLDLLADLERDPSGAASATGRQMQEQAEGIRQEVIRTLARFELNESIAGQHWFGVTLAEANLGCGRYETAREWARAAASVGMKGWELESAARQLAHMARLQARKEGLPPEELERTEAWSVVEALLGNAAAALAGFRGKVGLALSGGGFRASLYHIGVFARLAELDVLRHVEVISCVSGGSILGTYYYLELKHLLETRADGEITREDYIALVARMERNFLDGVQRNIRTRMLLEFGVNLKSLAARRPPTSERLGELYERELYSRVPDGHTGPRYLTDLIVEPAGAGEEFRPRYDNWRRVNKVPILVLNSATLNTCHSWQFTGSFMGEPPARGVDSEIEANDRLRRMYHDEAPPGFRNLRLGWAVAASACVPGLFDPLLFDGLYEDGYLTRLVDGGVYDNQGVASLLEQDCTVLLVSDASGQTGAEKDPADNRLGVPARANSILMARVRESQYQLLAHLRDAGVLSGLMYVHLKKDLDAGTVDWVGCPDPSPAPRHAVLTRYGIRKDVQALIAGIRTDLDSFCDVEADALMLSGYQMTASEFPRSVQGFGDAGGGPGPWRFLDLRGIAGDPGASPELAEVKAVLRAAASLSFKAWQVSPPLRQISHAVAAAAALGAVIALRTHWTRPLVEWGWSFSLTGKGTAMLAGAAALAGLLKFHVLPKWLRYRSHFSQWALSLAACLAGWAVLALHLRAIDPLWIRCGPRYRNEAEGERAGAAAAGE